MQEPSEQSIDNRARATIHKVRNALQKPRAKRDQLITLLVEDRLKQFDELQSLKTETRDVLREHVKYFYLKLFRAKVTWYWIYNFQIFTGLAAIIFIIYICFHLEPAFIASISLLNGIYIGISIFIGVTTPFFSIYASEKLYLKRHAISLIIEELMSILLYEETQADSWTDFYHKGAQLTKLERVAFLIEKYLSLQLLSHVIDTNSQIYPLLPKGEYEPALLTARQDRATTSWIKENMKQVAAALREKKKWILTPKKDTRENFIRSIASTFTCFVEGDWDTLERTEPMKLTSGQLRHNIATFLLKAFRTVVVAALPFVCFFVIQQTPYAITGPILNVVVTALTLWGLSVIGHAINPNFSSTITNIKNIQSLEH